MMDSQETKQETLNSEKSEEAKCLKELDDPCSLKELGEIFSNITNDRPLSDTLFKGKYLILILENLLKWQKPVGKLFQAVIAILGAKPRHFSETEDVTNEVFDENSGAPVTLQFDSFLEFNNEQSSSQAILKLINEKYILYPLSQNIGRKILLMCNSIDTENLKTFPILSVCHDKNPKALVLVGSSKQKQNSRFIVTNLGSVSNQEKLPRLSALKTMHLQGFPSSYPIETSVFARYDFLDFGYEKNSALRPNKDAHLIMECWWSNSLSILEPLTDDCTCFAKIKAVDGNFECGAYSMYKEIKFIETLQIGLETGVITWPNAENNGNVMKQLKEFINEAKSTSFKKEKSSSAVIELDVFDTAIVKGRTNLDFTDKLWCILKDCSSCEELIEGLEFVYATFEEFLSPPFIHQGNKCTIALVAKNLMEKLIICPVLNSKAALKLFLEIGVEKLRRDYVTLFLGLELIPYECISYFLQPELLSLNAVTCLKKMHSVLELAIVCVKQLKLQKDLLSEFVRNTLKHYTSVPDVDLKHVFSFQIPAVKARQLLNPMRPTIWKISFLSSSNDFLKQSVHHYQTTPTQEHIYAPDNYNPKLMLKTASYAYVRATLIEDNSM